MSPRPFFAALLLLVGLTQPTSAHDLNIVLREGGWEAGLRAVYFRPFTFATTIPLRAELFWDGRIDTLRTNLKTNEAGWDLLLISAPTLATGCEEGLLARLNWPAIGGRDHYRDAAVSDCGVGAFVAATVLAWDRDKFPGTPGWAEFWDVARVPGKRGLFRSPRGALEFALLSDGVPPGEVYRQLRGQEGVDRAFRRLDQLRPFIVWWETEAEAVRLLGSGEVLMTSAPYARVVEENREARRNFGVQWTGGLARMQYWAIVKGTPNLRHAEEFLYFAGMPAIQTRLPTFGGLAKGVAELLSPEAQAVMPTTPANMSALLPVDEAFWHEHGEKLAPRFAAWLGR